MPTEDRSRSLVKIRHGNFYSQYTHDGKLMFAVMH